MLTVATLVVVHGVLAGVTLLLAAFNLWAWARHRDDHSPLWQGVLALALVLVLLCGATVLVRPGGAAYEIGLFGRSGMLGVSAVLALFALAGLVPGIRIRFTVILLSCVVAIRMALWWSTDLVVHHRLPAGAWPQYGPLSWTSLIYGLGLLVVTIGAVRAAEGLVRRLLLLDIAATVAAAIVTVLAGHGVVFEAMLSLSVVPSAACILWLGARQIVRTARARDLLVIRQSALAELSRAAVSSSDLTQIHQAAERLLQDQTGNPDVRLDIQFEPTGPAPLQAAGRRCSVQAVGVGELDPATTEFVVSLLQVLAATADRAAADTDLAHNATHDLLTGLANRVLLVDRLTARLAAGEPTALVLCELAGLAELISIDGHQQADLAIGRAASALAELVGPTAGIGRLSTDVFAVISPAPPGELPGLMASLDGTLAVAAELPAQLRVAVGAVVAKPGAIPEDLLRDATAATRRAIGSGVPEIFADDLGIRLRQQVETERALRLAVDRAEIEVHYQPLVDPASREIRSYEALARWRRGSDLVPPLEWIPLAEQTGLIGAIGREVLRIACRDQARLDRPVAVNVSPHQLADASFVTQVSDVPGTCPPDRLTLEVTESAMMSDLDRAVNSLRQLQELGCTIALDDFGTSYSSLGVLATLPIDVLKIDRMFVSALDTVSGESVVSTVVALARALGKSTVAEGVETEEQLLTLARLGVDRIQGYLTGRPAPLAAHVAVNRT